MRPWTRRVPARSDGFRSGLEAAAAEHLKSLGVPVEYESVNLPYLKKPAFYKPDILLPNGIVVELKGAFPTQDRSKHLCIQAQHPEIEIRFVFSNPNTRISKQSTTTYGAWCEHKNIKFAKSLIPIEWVNEPPNLKSLAAIAALKKAKAKK